MSKSEDKFNEDSSSPDSLEVSPNITRSTTPEIDDTAIRVQLENPNLYLSEDTCLIVNKAATALKLDDFIKAAQYFAQACLQQDVQKDRYTVLQYNISENLNVASLVKYLSELKDNTKCLQFLQEKGNKAISDIFGFIVREGLKQEATLESEAIKKILESLNEIYDISELPKRISDEKTKQSTIQKQLGNYMLKNSFVCNSNGKKNDMNKQQEQEIPQKPSRGFRKSNDNNK